MATADNRVRIPHDFAHVVVDTRILGGIQVTIFPHGFY